MGSAESRTSNIYFCWNSYLIPAVATEALIIPRHVLSTDEDIWLVSTLEFDGIGYIRLEELFVIGGPMADWIELRKLDDLSCLKELGKISFGSCKERHKLAGAELFHGLLSLLYLKYGSEESQTYKGLHSLLHSQGHVFFHCLHSIRV